MAGGLGSGVEIRGALLAAGILTAGVISAACTSDGTPGMPSPTGAAGGSSSAECGPQQRARAAECRELLSAVRQTGVVNVIVTLTTRFTPEGELTVAERGAQRRAIAAAQDALLDELAPHRPKVIARYTATPQLALVVNEAALHALLASRRVSDIHQNTPQPPG